MSKPFMQSDILSTSIGIYYRTIEWLNQFIVILLETFGLYLKGTILTLPNL